MADGGLAVALAECALLGDCGASLGVEEPVDVALFSEDQGRAIVTCLSSNVDAVLALASDLDVPAVVAGETGGDRLIIDGVLDVSVARLRGAWDP